MSLEDEIASNSDLQSILERFRRGEMPDPSDARTREVLERFKQRAAASGAAPPWRASPSRSRVHASRSRTSPSMALVRSTSTACA